METEAPFDPRKDVIERLAFSRHLFGADIRATPSEILKSTQGGASRCGYDFMFELVGFFETFGKLLSDGPGEIQGPSGAWVRSPAEFQQKEQAFAALDKAAENFVGSLQGYQGDFVNDVFESPVGPFTPLGMGNLAVWHVMYHSGQLNYIQTIHGDDGFHWMPEAK
jgi:hypothetical protein